MKAELVLGFDPVPGDPRASLALSDALRTATRGVVEARSALGRLTAGGPGWDGPAGEAVLGIVREISGRLGVVEGGLASCQTAVEEWRAGEEDRRQRSDRVVEAVADLAGQPDGEDRRARLENEAREILSAHEAAAAALCAPFDDFAEVLIRRSDDVDLAAELDQAVGRLTDEVDAWIGENADELVATATALGQVAGLTTVVTELLGVSSFDRVPEDADGVKEIVGRSPGSHRLVRALRRHWNDVAPESLPAATFGQGRRDDLAELLASVSTPPDADRGHKRGSGE